MAKTGRNEPCPCGSGKKHKNCCGRSSSNILPFPGTPEPPDDERTTMERLGTPNMATEILRELQAELSGRAFSSRAEMEAAFARAVERRRKAPLDDFLGLSPETMRNILSGSFQGIHGILEIRGGLDRSDIPAIPLLDQSLALLGYLLESGPVKATDKGNLPRSLVQRWWDERFGPEEPDDRSRAIFRPTNEDGSWPIHCARLVARKAGLIKLHDRKFSITEKGRSLLEAGDLDSTYHALFVAVAWGIDWNEGRRDYQAVHPFPQRSFVFNLHLLGALARDWAYRDAIVEAYLKAFPMLRDDYRGQDPETADMIMRIDLGYGLTHFPSELGLLESRSKERWSASEEFKVSPLFDRLLGWKL